MNTLPAHSDTFHRDGRLGAGVGVATVVAVGVGMLVAQNSDRFVHGAGSPVLAWTAYTLYLIVFCLDAFTPQVKRWWWWPRAMIAVLVVSGIVLRLAAPGFDWTAVLFVVTAAAAAFEMEVAPVAGIVILQTIIVAVSVTIGGADTFSAVLITCLYLAFQVFAVLLVRTARREVEARRHLAATNAELRAATALLDGSSRNTERLRIARDLHDIVGHQLTALTLELEIAGHKAEGDVADHVAQARTTAKELLSDIREVVSELRETSGGIDSTIRPILSGLPGLIVELDIREDRLVDETRALAVARLLQEVSTNALRHASARHLIVSVVSDNDGIRVEARDDGTGASRWRPGNGLIGMQERIAQLGGTVTFDTAPGRGFGVEAWIP